MGSKISQQCKDDFCSQQYPNKPKKDWMKQLPDSLFLSEISIPGTYKSLSLNPKPYACVGTQCIQQAWSLENQLLGGIRFIDLDTQIGNSGTEIHIYDNEHAISQKMNLIQVLDAIHSFLKKNFKEVVILKLNHLEDITQETSYKYVLQQEIENFHNRPIIQNQKVAAKDWLFFENYIPRLKEVRGKLVLFRQFYGDVGIKFKQNPVQFKIQDEFQDLKTKNLNFQQQQKNIIQEMHVHNSEINQEDSLRKTESGEMYAVNYVTQKGSITKTPFQNCQNLNSQMFKFDKQHCFLGIVLMNFPSEKLIDFIIKKCRERIEQKRQQKEERLQLQQSQNFQKKKTVDLENRGHLDSICSERGDLNMSSKTEQTQQSDSYRNVSISIKNMKSQLTTPLTSNQNENDEI